MIPATKVCVPEADRTEILRRIEGVLETGQFSSGRNVQDFEDEFARFTGAKHAVAVSSGGAALEATMRHLGVACKDVIVPTNTFFATASTVMMAGGNPVLCDIDPHTLSPSLENLKEAASSNTVGVTVVHVGGMITPEIKKIAEWCAQEGFWLVEDCAHAHGSRFDGEHAGRFGVAGAFSFFATKVMTSGEGGMVVTDHDDVAAAIRVMRDYGKPEPWTSFHTVLGANWRMNELEAAVGLVQLRRLNEFLAYRRKVAASYDSYLTGEAPYGDGRVFGAAVEIIKPAGETSWYKYVLLLPPGVDRDSVKAEMQKWNARPPGGVYELPLHQQPIFEGRSESIGGRGFPGAEEFCTRHLCLPIYFGMTTGEMHTVVRALEESINALKPEKKSRAKKAADE